MHHTIAPSIYKNLDYDLETSFIPLTMIALVPQVISINPTRVPVKTYAEFLAYVKKNPGKVNYASPGAGTAHHLAGESMKLETGPRSPTCPIAARARRCRTCWPATST